MQKRRCKGKFENNNLHLINSNCSEITTARKHFYRPPSKLQEGNVFACVCLPDLFKLVHLDSPQTDRPVQINLGTPFLDWPILSHTGPPYLFKLVHDVVHTSIGNRLAIDWKAFLFIPFSETLKIFLYFTILSLRTFVPYILFKAKRSDDLSEICNLKFRNGREIQWLKNP